MRDFCRYQQYLTESRGSEVVIQICNHNYLLADAVHRQQELRPLLKEHHVLVVDEAHKLPDMQSKLRQGFGRAIRTETDTCVVAVLDSRAAEGQRYHAAVLEALPKCRLSDNLEDVARFVRERKTPEYIQQ